MAEAAGRDLRLLPWTEARSEGDENAEHSLLDFAIVDHGWCGLLALKARCRK